MQNPLCVKSCVTKKIRYSYEHTFTAVDSMRRKPCVRNCSREREGLYNENILLAHLSLYSSFNRLYAQNPVFEIVHDKSVEVYLHMYNGNLQQNPLCVESCVTKEIQYSHEHTFTAVDSMRRKPCARNCSREHEGLYNGNFLLLIAHLSLYSGINRFYAQKPVFEVVHDESVKVYLHMYNGNVQQNPPCVESCVTKEFSISLRFSPTIFDPDTNSALLRAHLCPAVDSKSCVQNCSREREGLYNGNAQQNSLCSILCHSISPRFSPTFFYCRANPAPCSAQFLTHPSPN